MNDILPIGENLKKIRSSRGLSLDAVSSITGVSKTMLSQIERSESVPTVATVSKIANGLKLRFDDLLENSKDLYCDIKKISDISPVIDNGGKIQRYCLFPFSRSSGFEIFYCVIKPGCDHSSETHQNGRTEYMMVAQGELDLITDSHTFHLEKGSSIAFDASKSHQYINHTDQDAIVYFVLSY